MGDVLILRVVLWRRSGNEAGNVTGEDEKKVSTVAIVNPMEEETEESEDENNATE